MKNENTMLDNKTIRREESDVKYVIEVDKDNVRKYIGKHYGEKNRDWFSVKPGKAKAFKTFLQANGYITQQDLFTVNPTILKLERKYTVEALKPKTWEERNDSE